MRWPSGSGIGDESRGCGALVGVGDGLGVGDVPGVGDGPAVGAVVGAGVAAEVGVGFGLDGPEFPPPPPHPASTTTRGETTKNEAILKVDIEILEGHFNR